MGQRVSMSSIMGNGNKSEGDSERERWDRLRWKWLTQSGFTEFS